MKKEEHPIIKEKKHKARRRSIQEGIFAGASQAFGARYFSPFAIAINSSNSLVAMLSSISGLLGPFTQLFSSRLIEKHSRKKIVRNAIFIEVLMWIPIIITAILFHKGIITNILPIMFLLFFGLHLISANSAGPAWFSWMGDIVDEEYRGRWFSKRNLLVGFVIAILAILSSFLLDYFKKIELAMIGFIILFSLAMISRFISWRVFKKQYEPKIKLKKDYYFSFFSFLSKSTKTNFGKFSIFRAFLSFSTAIAGSLIAVYLLRNLNFSYKTYMIITLSGTIFSLSVLELWGKIADEFGNYKVMVISSLFIFPIPILYIISASPIYLILVPSIIGATAWAGFNLAAGNFIYDNISSEKRGLAVSYHHMLNGIGTFLGAGLGAILIKFIHTGITPIITIFIISSFLRFSTIILGLPYIKEIKDKKTSSKKTLEKLILKETKPTLIEESQQLMSIKKYIFEK